MLDLHNIHLALAVTLAGLQRVPQGNRYHRLTDSNVAHLATLLSPGPYTVVHTRPKGLPVALIEPWALTPRLTGLNGRDLTKVTRP
jgi:hypothetical protein